MDNKNLLEQLEKLDPGIVLFDNDFSITHINQALMAIFGDIPREKLLGRDLRDIHGSKSRERLREVFALMKDSTRSVPFSIKQMSSGTLGRFLLLKLMPLVDRDQKDSLNCCLVYDITSYISTSLRALIKIPVTFGNGIKLIDLAEIFYFKAENIYSKVFTADGEFFCDLALGTLEEGVSQNRFFRIHRSYIVNLDMVDKINREPGSLTVCLKGSEVRLPVSRYRSKEFLEKLGLR